MSGKKTLQVCFVRPLLFANDYSPKTGSGQTQGSTQKVTLPSYCIHRVSLAAGASVEVTLTIDPRHYAVLQEQPHGPSTPAEPNGTWVPPVWEMQAVSVSLHVGGQQPTATPRRVKTVFLRHLYLYKNEHFTKTGSGQTQKKTVCPQAAVECARRIVYGAKISNVCIENDHVTKTSSYQERFGTNIRKTQKRTLPFMQVAGDGSPASRCPKYVPHDGL